jgi:hypothetical protein
MQRAHAWAGHRTRMRPWSAWRSCLSVLWFLLTANGFEMAVLLGRGVDGVDSPRVLVY